MRHFDFETNIQERMPQTGKVFFVKRMTADYAECYPFDVDGFIEDIYQKYQQVAADDPRLAAWAKTREELRRQWVKTLSVTRNSGDATIYPNRDGRQEPALMEVWQKAGDYWARGLRIGDTLPKIVPPCRITRLPEGGWIALFPNEMHLLDESTLQKIDGGVNAADNDLESIPMINEVADGVAETSAADSADCEAGNPVLAGIQAGGRNVIGMGPELVAAATSSCQTSPAAKPVLSETDEMATGQDTTETIATASDQSGATPAPEPEYSSSHREIVSDRRIRLRLERERAQRSYEERMEREAMEAEQDAREEQQKKILAAVGAVAVTLVMIHFFGLLGPAVFGLLCGGLLKG